nr:transposase [Paenibacillus monticola]
MQGQVHALFANIEAAEDQEEHACLGRDLPKLGESSELSSEKLEQVTQKLEAQLLEKPKDKPLKKVVRKLRKDLLPRLLKYEQYQVLLGDRNSFSKTDPDATFMRMKEDHMRNGQLKPGYYVQIGTENQFILTYSLHPRPTDTRCLQPPMENARQILGKLPQTVIADAGYGSEENYAYLEKKEIQAVVKYGSYHKEKSKAWKENVGKIENWTYTETEDTWMCSTRQTLHFRKESKEIVESGYEIRKRHYRSESYEGCPLREGCTKAAGNREVVVSLKFYEVRKVTP